MPANNSYQDTPILVGLTGRPGVQQVSRPLVTIEQFAAVAAKGLDSAMHTIHALAARASTMIDGLPGDPDEVEIEFGLTLDPEGQAWVAKMNAEGTFSITLTWKREEPSSE